jgi:hypothetical protein
VAPSEEGFSEREIVFLAPFETEYNIFGFVKPNGSTLITRTVALEHFTNGRSPILGVAA